MGQREERIKLASAKEKNCNGVGGKLTPITT